MSSQSRSYLKITKGDEIKSAKEIEDAERKEKLEKIKNFTKISMGKVMNNSNIVHLSCVFGIIPGQSITGFGIPEGSYVTEINNDKNLIRMNQPADNTSSHTIITVNGLRNNNEEEEGLFYETPYNYYDYSDIDYYYADEESIQNY